MRAAKVPVLARMKESCAAAFTVDELNGINAFYESSARRAWLEKGRILMRPALAQAIADVVPGRSEEHTSELQSLMRISYAVFCLKKKNTLQKENSHTHQC